MRIWNTFKESFKLMKEHKANVALIMLFDIAFLFISFLSWIFISKKVAENYAILFQYNSNLQLEEAVNQESLQILSQQLGVMQGAINKILFFLILAIVLVLVYYGFFRALNWLISRNIIEKRHIFDGFDKRYIWKFYLIVLLWGIILSSIIFGFGRTIMEQLYFNQSLWNIGIFLAIISLFLYFMTISFSAFVLEKRVFKSIKDSFLLGIKRFYILIPSFLVILAIAYLVNLILTLLVKINVLWWLVSVIGIFLAVLILAWIRLYVLLVIRKYL